MRGIDDLGGGDGEVEHFDGQDGVDEGLRSWVVRARHQPEQLFSEFGGDDFQVLKDVARRDVDRIWPSFERLKLNGCILHCLPVLVASEVGPRQDRRANHG